MYTKRTNRKKTVQFPFDITLDVFIQVNKNKNNNNEK